MDIDQKVKSVLEEAEKTGRNAVFICSSDFSNFFLGWMKVIDNLKKNPNFRVRAITKFYTVANCSNSDGDGTWDEPCSTTNYFLTKKVA